MTICREWMLVNQNQTEARAKPLTCKSWNCEYCAPKRRRKLIAQVCSGTPHKFLTLTVNPAIGESPEDRHAILALSWKTIVKRMRRRFPKQEVEYFSVTEATKNGEPHLHIVGRFPFLHQSIYSEWMRELAGSPIVHIKKVRGVREITNYLAKYVGKEPAKFGNAKRYFYSGAYLPEDNYEPASPMLEGSTWSIFRGNQSEWLRQMTYSGWALRRGEADWLVGHLIE